VLLWVLLGALPVLAGVGYAGGATLAAQANSRDVTLSSPPAASGNGLRPTASPSPLASVAASGSPVPAPTWMTSRVEPKLREVTVKAVLGPVFQSRDPTYTAAFAGWPFAFRVPPSWGCVDGQTLPGARDAYRKVCIDESNTDSKRAVVVSLQQCTIGCTAARMKATALNWLRVGWPVQHDARTWYVLTAKDADGLYVVDLAHSFTVDGRHYVVAVYARAFPDDTDEVLKVLNDIVAQAG
jgi:hypothetical protein